MFTFLPVAKTIMLLASPGKQFRFLTDKTPYTSISYASDCNQSNTKSRHNTNYICSHFPIVVTYYVPI